MNNFLKKKISLYTFMMMNKLFVSSIYWKKNIVFLQIG